MDDTSILPCFKCGGEIKIDHESLLNAMSFISHGGWASEYDPLDHRKFLRIHICDKCVEAAAKQGMILEGTRIPVPDEVTYKKWNAEPEIL